jgi:hypothetical protein
MLWTHERFAPTDVASAHTWADLPLQGRTNGRLWKDSNIWPPTPPVYRLKLAELVAHTDRCSAL